LYDIRPGNGAGLFLQPRSPHGAGEQGNSRPAFQIHGCLSTTAIKLTPIYNSIKDGRTILKFDGEVNSVTLDHK